MPPIFHLRSDTMKFKGEPNLYVRIANKSVKRLTGEKGFCFDNNGIYETDNEILRKVLPQHFEVVEETAKKKEKPVEMKYKCKKCEFETANKGELMLHYKENHPKEGK
jgi:hypothetical protein